MVASKAGHALLAATIAGGRPDGDRQHSWNVPPTPAPSLETQLPGGAFPAHRPVRFWFFLVYRVADARGVIPVGEANGGASRSLCERRPAALQLQACSAYVFS